jgi:probable selenium-dependent hydroxylase accessory protein YqeC
MSGGANFPDKGLICFTGSGGKTTLMLRLARRLKEKFPVLVTCTTRMAVEEIENMKEAEAAEPPRVLLEPDASGIKNRFEERGIVFLFRERDGGKYVGLSPETVLSFRRRKLAPYILTEADGSLGLPLKGYAEYEPPLPARVDCHFVVVGLDALSRPMNEDTAARFEILKRFLNIEKNAILTPPLLLKLLTSPDMYLRNSPPAARRVLCLNKADLVAPDLLKEWLAYLLPRLRGYSEVRVTGPTGDYQYAQHA